MDRQRGRPRAKLNLAGIYQDYEAGASLRQLAKRWRVGHETVRRYLMSMECEMRERGHKSTLRQYQDHHRGV